MVRMVGGFMLPLALLLGGGGAASSQVSCSNPEVSSFLRQQFDGPFNGATSLLTAIQIPVPTGLRYELSGMAAIDTAGLMVTCTAQATPVSGDGKAYGATDVLYTLVRNDAGGLNIRVRTDALEQLQQRTYSGVMMRAVRNGDLPGQIKPVGR